MLMRISNMGAWMLHQGYTHEQVMVYEAYLIASKQGRIFTCLIRRKS